MWHQTCAYDGRLKKSGDGILAGLANSAASPGVDIKASAY